MGRRSWGDRRWCAWSICSRRPWCRSAGTTSAFPGRWSPTVKRFSWNRVSMYAGNIRGRSFQGKPTFPSVRDESCKCRIDQTTGKRMAPQQTLCMVGDHFNSDTNSGLRIFTHSMKISKIICSYVRLRAEGRSCPITINQELEQLELISWELVFELKCVRPRSTRMKTSFHRLWLASPSSDSSIMMYATFAITWNLRNSWTC